MPKRKVADSSTDNVNAKIVEMLLELSEYEMNVTRQRFKGVAYRKAAGVIAKHPTPIKSGEEARKLSGIGAKIAQKIDEFIKSGKLEKLEKIRASDENVSIQKLTQVMGIGPAHARKLYEEGITTVEELRKHQDKLNHHQQLGVKYYEDLLERIPRKEMEIMEKFVQLTVQELDPEYKATVCGSYRRGAKTSGDLDLLITHPSYTAEDQKNPDLLSNVVKALSESHFITDSISHGDTKFMGMCRVNEKVLEQVSKNGGVKEQLTEDGGSNEEANEEGESKKESNQDVEPKEEAPDEGGSKAEAKQEDENANSDDGPSEGKTNEKEDPSTVSSDEAKEYRFRRIDIRVIPHDQYWCGVLYFTGSDGFNRDMRKKAQERGYMLNEYSVRKAGPGGKLGDPLPVHSEEDIFRHLKMKFVPPKDRND